jgi:propionate CoA-transferase
MELKPQSIINLGIGMPEGIAKVANEENILSFVTLTAEVFMFKV